jgi:hypothetical protein
MIQIIRFICAVLLGIGCGLVFSDLKVAIGVGLSILAAVNFPPIYKELEKE